MIYRFQLPYTYTLVAIHKPIYGFRGPCKHLGTLCSWRPKLGLAWLAWLAFLAGLALVCLAVPALAGLDVLVWLAALICLAGLARLAWLA